MCIHTGHLCFCTCECECVCVSMCFFLYMWVCLWFQVFLSIWACLCFHVFCICERVCVSMCLCTCDCECVCVSMCDIERNSRRVADVCQGLLLRCNGWLANSSGSADIASFVFVFCVFVFLYFNHIDFKCAMVKNINESDRKYML